MTDAPRHPPRHADVRPEDRLQESAGRLVKNRHKLRDDDPDLVGSIRIDGRILPVRAWVVELEQTAHIRLEVSRR